MGRSESLRARGRSRGRSRRIPLGFGARREVREWGRTRLSPSTRGDSSRVRSHVAHWTGLDRSWALTVETGDEFRDIRTRFLLELLFPRQGRHLARLPRSIAMLGPSRRSSGVLRWWGRVDEEIAQRSTVLPHHQLQLRTDTSKMTAAVRMAISLGRRTLFARAMPSISTVKAQPLLSTLAPLRNFSMTPRESEAPLRMPLSETVAATHSSTRG